MGGAGKEDGVGAVPVQMWLYIERSIVGQQEGQPNLSCEGKGWEGRGDLCGPLGGEGCCLDVTGLVAGAVLGTRG